jgi:DNA-directed RNA polymerase specialized sigma24 family protein
MVDVPDARLLRDLPTAHAVALRLDARGAAHDEIADALGLSADAIPGVLDVARAKLAELSATQPQQDGDA